MLSPAESWSHPPKKRRPISPTVGIDTPTSTYFQTPTFDLILKLEDIQKRIWEVEQKQTRHRKGKEGHKIKREKGALREEQALLAQVLAIRTATPNEEKKINPIVRVEPERKTLIDYIPTPLLRSFSLVGLALTLLTPGLALAEGGPTPEPTKSVPLSGHTLNIGRTGDRVSWWMKRDPKSPPIDVGKIQVAIADTYGPMNNPPGCADDIVKTNVSNIETEAAARARLQMSPNGVLYSSARFITIPEARMVVYLINGCALIAKQVISTVLPTVTPLPPSRIPSTTLPTKAQSSPTPVQLPTTTSIPQAEAPSTTDTTGEYIKYGLGGAAILVLLGLGSLAALVIRNGKIRKKEEEKEEQIPVPLDSNGEPITAASIFVQKIEGRLETYPGPEEGEITIVKPAVHLVPGYKDMKGGRNRYRKLMHKAIKETVRQVGMGDFSPQQRAATITHEGDHADAYLVPGSKADGAQTGTFVRVSQNGDAVNVEVGAYAKGTGAPSIDDSIRSLKAVSDPSESDKRQLRAFEELKAKQEKEKK